MAKKKKNMKICSPTLAVREVQIKDTVKRVRRQVTDWEKIFARGTSVKGLLPKICKELIKLSNKKTNNTILKMAQRL